MSTFILLLNPRCPLIVNSLIFIFSMESLKLKPEVIFLKSNIDNSFDLPLIDNSFIF